MIISSFSSPITLAAIAFAASFVLGFPVCTILLRLGVVDKPNVRSSHHRPTVRGGGIAILAAIILGTLLIRTPGVGVVMIPLVGLGLFLAVLSFWDDLKSLPPLIRFGGHAVAALAALALLGWPQLSIEISPAQSFKPWIGCGIGLMFLWLAGYTNAFNFMDGINGIAAGQAMLTSAASGLLAGMVSGEWTSRPILFSFVIAGAAAGFLPHNFPRARMFMGDVSSAPLGFLLAAVTLWIAQTTGWWLLIPLALLHANFVLDTAITLLRRIYRGERWYSAHREHFYQRFVRSGKSHTFVTLFEMGHQVIVISLMILYLYAGTSARLALIALVISMWFGFFTYCELQFRRSGTKPEPRQGHALKGIHIN